MNRLTKTRSEFCRGKAIKLNTTFNGVPAPGGSFYPESAHFVKRCKNPKAGKHPHGLGFGGIDSEIVKELAKRNCRTMELQIADELPRFCSFTDFVCNGFSVCWRDPRFNGARRYLDGRFWYSSAFTLRIKLNEAIHQEQKSRGQEGQLGLLCVV